MTLTLRMAEDIAPAAEALSLGGRWWFSRRNLYYELVRRRVLEPPRSADDPAFGELCSELVAHEQAGERLEWLVRPEEVPPRAVAGSLPPDIFDYSVRRVVVFERLEPMLVFAKNLFHHRIEVALVTADGFPEHVWDRLHAQLRGGLPTRLYFAHDCTTSGYALAPQLRKQLIREGAAKVRDLGLTVRHLVGLGLRLRSGARCDPAAIHWVDEQERSMLAEGGYVHLEELPPAAAMRWIYRFLARRVADAGFG